MLDNLNNNVENSRAQGLDVNDDEVEIDLLEIFYALKKKILLVLMVALAGGCIGGACTQFLMTPIYSSTSSIQGNSETGNKVFVLPSKVAINTLYHYYPL